MFSGCPSARAQMPPSSPLSPLLQQLAGGERRSIGQAKDVAATVLAQPLLLEEIIDGLRMDDPIIRSRVAHVVMQVALEAPHLVEPYKDVLLHEVSAIPQWEVREQISKVLPRLPLTPDEIAAAYHLYETYLADRSSIVRTCAMQGLHDLVAHDPSLKPRVFATLLNLTETGTAAMRARGRMLLAASVEISTALP